MPESNPDPRRSAAIPVFPFQIAVRSVQRSKEIVLRFSRRLSRRLALSVAVVGVVSAFGAASASAVEFSPAGDVVVSGTLTWELDGGSAVTCSFDASGSASGDLLWGGWHTGSCPNYTTTSGGVYYQATSTSSAGLYGWSHWNSPFASPNGYVYLYGTDVEFVNGNASTSSRMVFDDTAIGETDTGAVVSLSGSVTVTTPSGGLVTLVD